MCYEDRFDALSNLVANLRDVFPFHGDVDLAEIVHSPEYCLEAMIRYSGWKSIETAPKSGEIVLLCVEGFTPTTGSFDSRLGWIDFDQDDSELRKFWIKESTEFYPTHWMPLPKPPAGSP